MIIRRTKVRVDRDQALPNKLSHKYQKNCLHLLKDNIGVPKTNKKFLHANYHNALLLTITATATLATVVKGTPPLPTPQWGGGVKIGGKK